MDTVSFVSKVYLIDTTQLNRKGELKKKKLLWSNLVTAFYGQDGHFFCLFVLFFMIETTNIDGNLVLCVHF